MFTKGQSLRMSACLEGPRASFLTAAGGPQAEVAAPQLVGAAVGGNGAAEAVAPASSPLYAASGSANGEVDVLRREVASLRSILDQIGGMLARA